MVVAQQVGHAWQRYAGLGRILGIDVEVHVRHVDRLAVGQGGAAALEVQVVVGVEERQFRVGHRQAGDAGVVQRHQFAVVRHAIAVGVAPDAQFGKLVIFRVDHAVAVRVIAGQLGKARALLVAAKQFGNIVDLAIAVAVDGQQAVMGRDPARLDGAARAQQIEAAVEIGAGDGMHAVAVQVDHDRRDGGIPAHVVLARGQFQDIRVDHIGIRAIAVDVGIDVVVRAHVLRAPLPAVHGVAGVIHARLIELERVAARIEVGKLVVAIRVGVGGSEQCATARKQLHLDVGDARLIAILHAVMVGVAPHLVAQAGLAVDARIPAHVVLAGGQVDQAGTARARIDVGIAGVIADIRLGVIETRWTHDCHLVAAGDEVVEQIIAAGICRCRGNDLVAGIEQVDFHPRHAQFARLLHAVVIIVFPHAIADAAGNRRAFDQARIPIELDITRFQRDPGGGEAGSRIDIRIGGVAAHVGLGEIVAGGWHEPQKVVTGHQVAEQVMASGIRGGAGHHGARGVVQIDFHATHTRFACILRAVAVGVKPHAVANAGGFIQAGIEVLVVLAGGNGHQGALTRGVDVAVERIVATRILDRAQIAWRRDDGDGIGAGIDAEIVIAGGIRDGRADHAAGCIFQLHRDAADARFARILHAVQVGVMPDAVAQRGRQGHDARIQAMVAVAGSEQHLRRLAVDGAGVGIALLIAALVLARQGITGRQAGLVELDAVGARLQIREQIIAIRIRDKRAADGVARRIEQSHFDAGHARFTRILHAVFVGIEPHAVAQLGGAVQARVQARIGLARRQGDGRHVTGRIDIAILGRVATLVGRCRRVAIRRHDGDGIRAGIDIEVVTTIRIGGGRCHHRAGAVFQLHHDIGDASLARILHAVGILVFPDEVAQVGHRYVEGQVMRHQAQVLRVATGSAAVIAHLEAQIEIAGHGLARHEDQVARADIIDGDFRADRDGHAVEQDLPCRGGIGDDDGLEAVVLDVVVEAEIAFAEHDAGAIDQVEGLVGRIGRVVDGIDDHLQFQLDDIAIALVDRHLDGREIAVVVGCPVAGTHIHGVRVEHAEQGRVAGRFRIIRQQDGEILDVQLALHRIAGLYQQVADIKVLVDVFAHVNRGRQIVGSHAASWRCAAVAAGVAT